MQALPQEGLLEFEKQNLSVKRVPGKFKQLASDHALEQTLISASKVQEGLIGISSKTAAQKVATLVSSQKFNDCSTP